MSRCYFSTEKALQGRDCSSYLKMNRNLSGQQVEKGILNRGKSLYKGLKMGKLYDMSGKLKVVEYS